LRARANQIEVVVFDLGGVLVELRGVPTMLAWLDHRVTIEELWKLWLSSPTVRRFETGRSTPAEFADEIIAEMSLPISSQEFLTTFEKWVVGLLPGALDVVRSVPSRFKRVTLTNNSGPHWQRLMTEFGLQDAFDRHFASHLTGKIKPDREAFDNVLATLGCRAEAVIFLDDSTLNVEAARELGIHAVQVRGPNEARQALIEAEVIRA
jgi:glucose-1-phosphatase